jgi:exopolysaccharide biosynthesis polyprenyl glycosylphosphotransferase
MRVTPETTTAAALVVVTDRVQPAPSRPIARPFKPLPSFGHFPAWLRAVDGLHSANRSALTIGADLVVLAACGLAVGVGLPLAATFATGFVAALYLANRYADRGPLETQGLLWYASQTVVAVAIATLVGVAISRWADIDTGKALLFGWVGAGGLLALRTVTWMVLAIARRRGVGMRRTLIVGDSAHAQMLANKLNDYPEAGLLPVSMLPLRNGHGFARLQPLFPSADTLCRVIKESSVEHVVLAPDGSDSAILECIRGSSGLDVSYSILPPLAEFFLRPGHVAQVGGLPLIPLGKMAKGRTALPGKRLFDLVLSLILFVVLSPVMLGTAVAIKLLDKGPLFYRQTRVGRGGKTFSMLKFRSMVPGAEQLLIDLRDHNVTNGLLFKVPDDPRITRTGRVLRRFALDELPQLWNVIRGEMSLVGPRPLAVRPEDFGPIDDARHGVMPGITGYWQIAGGNGLTYEEMVKLDLAYIENWSIWLDVRLLLRTIPAVVHRRGPY